VLIAAGCRLNDSMGRPDWQRSEMLDAFRYGRNAVRISGWCSSLPAAG
jgi:hypothetical protein